MNGKRDCDRKLWGQMTFEYLKILGGEILLFFRERVWFCAGWFCGLGEPCRSDEKICKLAAGKI